MVLNEDQLEQIGKTKVQQNQMYPAILQGVKEKFDSTQNGNRELVGALAEEHRKSQTFIEQLFKYDSESAHVIEFLKTSNKGPALAGNCKTLVMMDATASMYSLLQNVKKTLKEMFSRFGTILEQNGHKAEQSLMKIAFYRNYNADYEEITGESDWELDPMKLI